MSQRNPMNDRYQTDEHRGQTRKSAATMKAEDEGGFVGAHPSPP